jgi:cysteinyl-tRNA synthetase
MNFSWEALEGSNARLSGYRRRMQEWAADGAGPVAGEADVAKALEGRFREAVTDDLDMPRALVVLDETVASSGVSPAAKRELLGAWDRVLALDLDRLTKEAWEPNEEMRDLVRRRDEARAAKDFAQADALRDQLTAMGLEVMDSPDGTKIRPRA